MSSDDHDPARWLDEHGDAMFAYAMGRLRRREAAEDLVQEALLAAWKSRDSFAGQSQRRTWLIGILRHKLIDHLRRQSRQPVESEADGIAPFGPGGGWKKMPANFDEPSRRLSDAELREIIRTCREALPPTLAGAFILRDVDDVPTEEACKLLGITPTNLAVRLHRARLAMRACVESKWFGEKSR